MKSFVDEAGTFKIKVPTTWKYSLKNGKHHTFQEYEIWKPSSFQISIKKITDETERANIIKKNEMLLVSKIGDIDYYSIADIIDDEFTTKSWTKLFDDDFVFFTLTYPNNPDKDLDNTSVSERIDTVVAIIKEFKLIKDSDSAAEINSYRFDMFLQGVGATALMLNKAVENKAFIEATCLLGNLIDASLRIGIVLKSQIINNNRVIEKEWIYQGLSDKKKSEKDIYKKALELGVIDQSKYDDLVKLYEDRNRVIHRFIISEITLAEVEEIAYKYSNMSDLLSKIIYDLESEQITLNVGMSANSDGKENTNHIEYIKGKIGKLSYFDEKDNSEKMPNS